jgi:hypothetical protein
MPMANTFGMDILIQAKNPTKAAKFYLEELGFEIRETTPKMISLHGKHICLSRKGRPWEAECWKLR